MRIPLLYHAAGKKARKQPPAGIRRGLRNEPYMPGVVLLLVLLVLAGSLLQHLGGVLLQGLHAGGLFFRRRVSLPVWIAVALSVGALYLLCIKGSFSLAPGDLLVLVCAICFSVHILVIDHFTATCDGVKLSCLQFLFAGTWSTILALFFDTISFQVLLDCIWPLLYVGVFSCGVGYTLQILAQKGSNPTVVTILLSLESVFAVIAGAVVLHQQMTAREYLGCVLMFAAVVLAQIPMPQKKEAKAE